MERTATSTSRLGGISSTSTITTSCRWGSLHLVVVPTAAVSSATTFSIMMAISARMTLLLSVMALAVVVMVMVRVAVPLTTRGGVVVLVTAGGGSSSSSSGE